MHIFHSLLVLYLGLWDKSVIGYMKKPQPQPRIIHTDHKIDCFESTFKNGERFRFEADKNYLSVEALVEKSERFWHSGHLRLKVPNVKFDFDVSVRSCLLSTHTSIEFDVGYSFACHDKDSSIWFRRLLLTYQCTYVKNLTSNINLMFHTFSGMCLWPFWHGVVS